MAETHIELVPVGTFMFLDRRLNPAELFPGTSWEEYTNELYITSEEDQKLDEHGRPIKPFDKVITWLRIK